MDDYSNRLSKLINKYYLNIDFRVMFTCPNTIGSLFSHKDKTPLLLRSLVVYKIKCRDCDDFYIGKTARCLNRRIDEHRKGKGDDENKSSLFQYSVDKQHNIDYDNIEIIDKANNDRKLKLKEIMHINNFKPTLNKQKQSALFSLIIGKKS